MEANCFASDDGLGAPRLVLCTDDDDLLLLLENLERCRRKLHLLIRHDVGQHRHWHGRDGNLALCLLLVGRFLDGDGALAFRWWHVEKSARGSEKFCCVGCDFSDVPNRKVRGVGCGLWDMTNFCTIHSSPKIMHVRFTYRSRYYFYQLHTCFMHAICGGVVCFETQMINSSITPHPIPRTPN